MSADPTAEHIDAMEEHYPMEGQGGAIECVCGWPRREDFTAHSDDWWPDYNEHAMASLPAEAMLAALVDRGTLTEEWAIQYECDLSTPMMSGETEMTVTTQVPSEDRARQAVKNYAPINARNRRAASRLVTPWGAAP